MSHPLDRLKGATAAAAAQHPPILGSDVEIRHTLALRHVPRSNYSIGCPQGQTIDEGLPAGLRGRLWCPRSATHSIHHLRRLIFATMRVRPASRNGVRRRGRPARGCVRARRPRKSSHKIIDVFPCHPDRRRHMRQSHSCGNSRIVFVPVEQTVRALVRH